MNKLILGPLLGAILRRRMGGTALGRVGGLAGGRGALIAMLLPYAMQWVQRNGGLGAVLKRFKDKGYGTPTRSWVGTGDNQPVDVEAVDNVVGREELSRLSRQLGVPESEVKQGFAEILPEMVDQLTPEGDLRPDVDRVIEDSLPGLEEVAKQVRAEPANH
ncbi:YidB family protein [Ramlibacter sp.]|uniref:YidB family protein n=1 Tax=Ramlibacter sp. TaxID=1917967 RepID=UPI003D0A64B9